MSLLPQQQRRHAAVHPAAHGGQYLRHGPSVRRRYAAHGQNRPADQIVQAPTQHLRPPLNHFPGTARRKVGRLVLLLHRLQLQILHAFGGPHQGHRPDQPRQLVA